MHIHDRKISNYSTIRSCNVLILTIALVITTFTFPLGTQTERNIHYLIIPQTYQVILAQAMDQPMFSISSKTQLDRRRS